MRNRVRPRRDLYVLWDIPKFLSNSCSSAKGGAALSLEPYRLFFSSLERRLPKHCPLRHCSQTAVQTASHENPSAGIEKTCQACDEDNSPGPKYTIPPLYFLSQSHENKINNSQTFLKHNFNLTDIYSSQTSIRRLSHGQTNENTAFQIFSGGTLYHFGVCAAYRCICPVV